MLTSLSVLWVFEQGLHNDSEKFLTAGLNAQVQVTGRDAPNYKHKAGQVKNHISIYGTSAGPSHAQEKNLSRVCMRMWQGLRPP